MPPASTAFICYSYHMKIVSWNVNGLRATHKSGAWDAFLKTARADVICLQETKSSPEQLPEEVRNLKGLHSYFSSSTVRKGYSGVALYSRVEPDEVITGLGIKKFDEEGRMVGARFGKLVVLTAYFPNGGQGPHRLAYKLEFYDEFLKFIDAQKALGHSVIFCGDVNTAHEEIDLARPKENSDTTGFLPEERAWIDEVINHGYIDTWRHFHPNTKDAYTYWDMKTRARDRNVGWRLDYFFASRGLLPKIKHAEILPEIYGSDHCPISLEGSF